MSFWTLGIVIVPGMGPVRNTGEVRIWHLILLSKQIAQFFFGSRAHGSEDDLAGIARAATNISSLTHLLFIPSFAAWSSHSQCWEKKEEICPPIMATSVLGQIRVVPNHLASSMLHSFHLSLFYAEWEKGHQWPCAVCRELCEKKRAGMKSTLPITSGGKVWAPVFGGDIRLKGA